jgi:carboxyl-terminal processing protease
MGLVASYLKVETHTTEALSFWMCSGKKETYVNHGKENLMMRASNRIRFGAMSVLFMFVCGAFASDTTNTPIDAAGAAVATGKVDTVESAYLQMELLTEVLMQVRSHYVEERTYEELLHGAIAGMLRSLDPHSSFMEADQYDNLIDDTAGQYGGIGIHIGIRNGVLTVISPIEDTPAFRAGLQSGDMIMEIDGESTVNMSMRDAVKRLRGPKGETVTVSIVASGDTEPRDVDIVRDVIEVSSVKGATLLTEGIGYVRLTQFAEPTAEALKRELFDLEDVGMQALILDLRGNPGGLLTQAIEVSQLFLEPDSLVVSTKGRGALGKRMEYRAAGNAHYTELPMVILVNGGSASASEIVAGAMQDHHRAVLIGETTFGKGSVQSIIRSRTDGESAIRLTTAYYYTPAERLIHEIGLKPDIKVPMTRTQWMKVQQKRASEEAPAMYSDEEKREFEDAFDAPLQRAVDLLKALLIVNKQGNS